MFSSGIAQQIIVCPINCKLDELSIAEVCNCIKLLADSAWCPVLPSFNFDIVQVSGLEDHVIVTMTKGADAAGAGAGAGAGPGPCANVGRLGYVGVGGARVFVDRL